MPFSALISTFFRTFYICIERLVSCHAHWAPEWRASRYVLFTRWLATNSIIGGTRLLRKVMSAQAVMVLRRLVRYLFVLRRKCGDYDLLPDKQHHDTGKTVFVNRDNL